MIDWKCDHHIYSEIYKLRGIQLLLHQLQPLLSTAKLAQCPAQAPCASAVADSHGIGKIANGKASEAIG